MTRQTFAEFMSQALYGPDGYYTRRPRLGGEGADFFTSPELHPVFGALIGRQVAEVWEELGRPTQFELVEYGPGSGALCRDILAWARHDATEFAEALRVSLVEVSPPLRAAQRQTLERARIDLERVRWLDPTTASSERVVGFVLANELLDALPVHLVTVRDDTLLERYVESKGSVRRLVDGAPSTARLIHYFDRLGLRPGEGCVAEANLEAVELVGQMAASLTRGMLLILDYGYPAPELYAASRTHGTLLCYRQHTLNSDPFSHVGQQDITSHVDFTSVAQAGERAGLITHALLDQTVFLANLGLPAYRRLLDRSELRGQVHHEMAGALAELANPDGLGAVKVLLQSRGLPWYRPSGAGPSRLSAPTWLPTAQPGQLRAPGPPQAEGAADVDSLWRELWPDPECTR